MVTKKVVSATTHWGLSTEGFFFHFMGLRKGEIRGRVDLMRKRFPEDSPRQLARRFVAAQRPLSLVGGALLHVPMAVPALGPALRLLGIAAGSTVTIHLNMALVLEIALLYGHDIDDRARLKEILAIIAATALASGSFLLPYPSRLGLRSRAALGTASVVTVNQLIGEVATRYYARKAEADIGLQRQGVESAA